MSETFEWLHANLFMSSRMYGLQSLISDNDDLDMRPFFLALLETCLKASKTCRNHSTTGR